MVWRLRFERRKGGLSYIRSGLPIQKHKPGPQSATYTTNRLSPTLSFYHFPWLNLEKEEKPKSINYKAIHDNTKNANENQNTFQHVTLWLNFRPLHPSLFRSNNNSRPDVGAMVVKMTSILLQHHSPPCCFGGGGGLGTQLYKAAKGDTLATLGW